MPAMKFPETFTTAAICCFLVEAWNDRRYDGLAVDIRPRRIALARNVAHRLQRSPQLAQAAGG